MYENYYTKTPSNRYSINDTQSHSLLTPTPSTKSLKDYPDSNLLRNRIISQDYSKFKHSESNRIDHQLLERENEVLKIEIEHLKE